MWLTTSNLQYYVIFICSHNINVFDAKSIWTICPSHYKSSDFTTSDLFITPDLEDFFSTLMLKFDFLTWKSFLPTVEHLVVLIIFSSEIYQLAARIYIQQHTLRYGPSSTLCWVEDESTSNGVQHIPMGWDDKHNVTHRYPSLLTTTMKHDEHPPQLLTIGHEDPPPGLTDNNEAQ